MKNRKEVPYYDFFERPVKSDYDLEEVLDNYVFSMEMGYFLMWEAVVNKENGIELTEAQEEVFGGLINFGDEEDDILYIDECARPNKNWYEIANEIAERLKKGRIKSYEIHSALLSEGWGKLKESIIENSKDLSCPEEIQEAIQVIPENLRHNLEIQESVDWLVGLGQNEELNLANPEQNYRVSELIKDLKKKLSSVEYLKLSISKITEDFIELKNKDRLKFEEEMMSKLSLKNIDENMSEKLKKYCA